MGQVILNMETWLLINRRNRTESIISDQNTFLISNKQINKFIQCHERLQEQWTKLLCTSVTTFKQSGYSSVVIYHPGDIQEQLSGIALSPVSEHFHSMTYHSYSIILVEFPTFEFFWGQVILNMKSMIKKQSSTVWQNPSLLIKTLF